MRVVMVSKACYVAAYRQKLEALARLPGIDLSLIVPPYWIVSGSQKALERGYESGYELIVERARFAGHHHVHWYPRMGQQIDRLRPDIVHIDEEPYDFVAAHTVHLACRRGARTVFFTWQNIDRSFPPPFRWFEEYVLNAADGAIAGNREAGTILRRKGFAGKLEEIPQFGIEPDLFQPATQRKFGSLRIGYAGRLVEEKGLLVLIAALAGLEGDWEAHFIGEGPLLAEMERRVTGCGIRDRIHFHGAVSSVEMPSKLAELDVLVLPSLTRPHWKEQFGRVLVEAMACAVPVVGSNSGEIPNVIGDAGLIVPEDDADALRQALANLLGQPDLRAELGCKGRDRALGKYTHDQIARQTYQLYQAILEPTL